MYIRRLIGVMAAGASITAIVVATQGLVPSIKAALIDHSPSLAAGGVLNAGLMLLVAALMAKLACRNLFWARYVESVRGQGKHRDHIV